MRRLTIGVAGLVMASSVSTHAAVLEVASGKKYRTLSAAASAAVNGDTVIVYPGTYTAGAVWRASNITIKGAPGPTASQVVVRSGVVGEKGLFVTTGANIMVQGLRFEGARSISGNGAGIGAEGKNLTVRDSIFYNNEMGILATPAATVAGTLTIANCRFDYNRSYLAGRIGHSVYGNNLDSLIVTGSTFTRNYVGHYIKSRAKSSRISGNRIDDSQGSASYLIDIPNGGAVTISNNVMIKGPMASNKGTAIALGFEKLTNPPGPILVSDNEFTNKTGAASTVFVYNRTSTPAQLTGNRAGPGSGPFVSLRQP